MYKIIPYGVRKDTETIDYDEMEQVAFRRRPKHPYRRKQRLFARL